MGAGGFGVVSEAFEISTGRAGIYKHIGEAKQLEEGAMVLSPAFTKEFDVTRKHAAAGFMQEYLEPASEAFRRTTIPYGGVGAAHEAAMQRIARGQYGKMVPEVYGTTGTGIFMESAGRPLASEERGEALKWLEKEWMGQISKIPAPGERIAYHLDPQIGNIMKKGKQYTLIDWGVATTEQLPRQAINRAETAYAKYVERFQTPVAGPPPPGPATSPARPMNKNPEEKLAAIAQQAAGESTKPVSTAPLSPQPLVKTQIPNVIPDPTKAKRKTQWHNKHKEAMVRSSINAKEPGQRHRRHTNQTIVI